MIITVEFLTFVVFIRYLMKLASLTFATIRYYNLIEVILKAFVVFGNISDSVYVFCIYTHFAK